MPDLKSNVGMSGINDGKKTSVNAGKPITQADRDMIVPSEAVATNNATRPNAALVMGEGMVNQTSVYSDKPISRPRETRSHRHSHKLSDRVDVKKRTTQMLAK